MKQCTEADEKILGRPLLRMLGLKLSISPVCGGPMSRREKILSNLNVRTLDGLEIGALASPIVQPADGRIIYVDHVDTKTLKDKYRHDPSVDSSKIVDVGAVWGAHTLQECLGSGRKVDYVVASHVIEHVPDLITWLAEIRAILKPGGSLRLAIPDRRYTFDYLRVESRIHDVADAYLRKARSPLPRSIIEHCSLIRIVDCAQAWDGSLDVKSLRAHSSTKVGLEQARDAVSNGTYYDSHCWVFTPVSFAELCIEMAELELLEFSCDYYFETPRNALEFYVSMTPSADKAQAIASWANMKASLLQSPTYQKPVESSAIGTTRSPTMQQMDFATLRRKWPRIVRTQIAGLFKKVSARSGS
jgi:SAM-dependent methyltransferase